MKADNKPYRHEVRSKLKTQVVDSEKSYNRKKLPCIAHEFEEEIEEVIKDEKRRKGNSEGDNFLKTQSEYKG